jgi:CRP/FNR family transcriptional regulator
MKTTRAIATPHAALEPHAAVSYLRSAAPGVAVSTTLLRLQRALGQLGELQRALASSRQESIAARQQVALLTKTNARFRQLAIQREQEVANVRHFAYHDELSETPDRDELAKPCRVDNHSTALRASIGAAPHEDAPGAAQRSNWALTDFCLSAGLDPDATAHIERLLTKRIRFRKGGVIYRFGDGFNSLYAIRTGSCKTVLLARDGQDQVSGYHMAGDIIGIDGIGTEIHECQATALEDMEVCPLPFDQIENLARFSDHFRHNLYRLLSQESARAKTLMLVLGTMRAEQRLAVFLLELSQRYRARGYSSCDFILRMTREEIGSYLGLKLETVSRLFSRFQREGLIQVQGRTVKLLDRVAVSQIVDSSA